jgi:hypothetical protein
MRRRFLSTNPGSTVKCTCRRHRRPPPGRPPGPGRCRRPALPRGRIWLGSRASLRVDQPSPSSSSSLRLAARSMHGSISSPPLPRLGVVVGVRHDLVRASDEPLHAVLQVIGAHGEVTQIAAGRLQPDSGGENIPDRQQAQSIEADQRYLLSELVSGDVADSEDGDPVDAIDAVVASSPTPGCPRSSGQRAGNYAPWHALT